MAEQMTVRSTVEGSTATITLSGHLAARGSLVLLDAVRDAIDNNAARIDLDLCRVTSFDDKGLAGLASCRDLCTGLTDGLHYRTAGDTSQAALLAAFDVPHVDVPDSDVVENPAV
jgi:ABC-type transporter Mla MlaB component